MAWATVRARHPGGQGDPSGGRVGVGGPGEDASQHASDGDIGGSCSSVSGRSSSRTLVGSGGSVSSAEWSHLRSGCRTPWRRLSRTARDVLGSLLARGRRDDLAARLGDASLADSDSRPLQVWSRSLAACWSSCANTWPGAISPVTTIDILGLAALSMGTLKARGSVRDAGVRGIDGRSAG